MKTLFLDMGNTRTKWGVRVCGEWQALGHFPAQDRHALEALWTQHAPINAVAACHVAQPEQAQQLVQWCAKQGVPLQWMRAVAYAAGVRNGYRSPEQLGPDRWAALIGARALGPGPYLVVCAGTATTIDALSQEGDFLGGIILPGLDLMDQALRQGTTRLGAEQSTPHYRTFPTNTADALYSGALTATLGAIEHQRHQLTQLQSSLPVILILSGGNAPLLAPLLTGAVLRVGHLVLEGLARFMEGPEEGPLA